MPNGEGDAVRFFLFIVAVIAIVFLAVSHAHAADPNYCQLYAREATRIGVASAAEEDLKTVAPDLPTVIKFSLSRNYAICLNADQDPALPRTPLASDSAWVEAVARNVKDRLGATDAAPSTVPATDAPAPAVVAYPPAAPTEPAKVAASKYSAADLAECRRQFRSFDPKDNTVIPYHHKRRQLCPLL